MKRKFKFHLKIVYRACIYDKQLFCLLSLYMTDSRLGSTVLLKKVRPKKKKRAKITEPTMPDNNHSAT